MNPWGITEPEAAALRAVIEHGGFKRAAKSLSKSISTVEGRIQIARVKLRLIDADAPTLLVAWDRWDRSGDAPPERGPWGLSASQRKVMDAVIKCSGRAAAADSLGMCPSTLNSHMDRALAKINAVETSRINRLVLWDRWARAKTA